MIPRSFLGWPSALAVLLFGCGGASQPLPVLPASCPKLAPVPTAPRPRSALSACQALEAHQEEALSQLSREHPEFFDRTAESDESRLDISIFRRCQRVRSGAVGLVPMQIEPSGIVTLRAVHVDAAGKEHDSAPLRVVEPDEWMILEGAKELVVVVNSSNIEACIDNRPCTSSEATALRFGTKEPTLAPLATRWLGGTAPIDGSDADSPLPWRFASHNTSETHKGRTVARVLFRWPSLRIGRRLYEGAEASVELDETLAVVQDTFETHCFMTAPVKSADWLWQSAECARLKGESVPVVLAALRARCEKQLSDLAQGKEPLLIGDDMCVDEADVPWLHDKDVRLSKRRPAVRLAPAVETVLARIGPAERFVKRKR